MELKFAFALSLALGVGLQDPCCPLLLRHFVSFPCKNKSKKEPISHRRTSKPNAPRSVDFWSEASKRV